MVVEYGIKLAINLISTHFGDHVSKVCDCVLRKGTLTLSDITRFTELSPQQVKNCLLVLIQHNCVQAYELEKEGDLEVESKGITYFKTIFENIIHRMRFSKFLAMVSEDLGRECEELLEVLLQHGRLTLEQILSRAREGNATDQDKLRAYFVKLVTSCYVERCPVSVPFIALPTEDEMPSTGKRGAKSAKLTQPKVVEQQAMTTAGPSEAEKNSVGTNNGAVAGEKRKHLELENDEGADAGLDEKEVLWHANFNEFVRRLRNKACVANVRSRLDDGAGIILSAMLEATRSTVPLSINAIFNAIIRTKEGRSMTYEHVRAAIRQLEFHPVTGETEELYCVDLKNVIEVAQNDEVESIVLKRYGRKAYIIFRLLSMTSHLLETDQISARTLVGKKEALAVLYKLWKDHYLQIQKTESHESQSKMQFLLWKVNQCSLKEHILNDMYHAVLNLSQRIAYELGREHEILQLPKDKRVGTQSERFVRIKKVRILLESSLMKVDDVLMLFHDFLVI